MVLEASGDRWLRASGMDVDAAVTGVVRTFSRIRANHPTMLYRDVRLQSGRSVEYYMIGAGLESASDETGRHTHGQSADSASHQWGRTQRWKVITMDEMTDQPIEQLVHRVQQQDLPRSRFIAILTGLGASATGVATLLSSADTATAAMLPPRRAPVSQPTQDHNKNLHAAHVRRQAHATQQTAAAGTSPAAQATETMSASHARKLQAIMDDYADNAVVEDPFFAAPVVGKEAIAQRKRAEMASIRDATIEVAHRFAHRNQVVAEWIMRGTHQDNFLGYPGTGRQIEVRGLTVVTREDGKITRESLHYDVADVHRQLS